MDKWEHGLVAFRRRSEGVELAVFDEGVLVRGAPGAIEALTEELERGPGRVRASRQETLDGVAALANIAGLAANSGNYFKLSQQSLQALRDANGGEIPTGWIRGVIRGDGGSILEHLDLKKVKLDPQQALSLQTAAVGMALRSAIAEVLEAVERVEGKVDEVARLFRAERLGNALGDHRTLSSLVGQMERTGTISATDWSAVASMGPVIRRDIEALRNHVRLALDREVSSSTRSRLDVAKGLLEESRVRESLELLLVVEENFNLWQVLRLAHVRRVEPDHLRAAVEHARDAVAADTAADQALIASLQTMVSRLLEPGGTEGLALLSAPALEDRTHELSAMAEWFADQRLLEVDGVSAEPWPGFRDSARHVLQTAASGAGELAGLAREVVRRRPMEDTEDGFGPGELVEADNARPEEPQER